MKNDRLLVDAKAVYDFARQSGFYPEFSRGLADLKTLKTLLKEESCAVDAVEVVRCRDCKHYRESEYEQLNGLKFCYILKDINKSGVAYIREDNDFCSRGERQNNG